MRRPLPARDAELRIEPSKARSIDSSDAFKVAFRSIESFNSLGGVRANVAADVSTVPGQEFPSRFRDERVVLNDKTTEVARRLGKSQTHLSMVCAMIDPPDWLMASYRSGKCQGLRELYELRRLHE